MRTCPFKSGLQTLRLVSDNAVNGVPTCLDEKAQNGYLRETLGFDGLIVSDCDAIGDAYTSHKYSATAADAAASGIKAGCDQVGRLVPPSQFLPLYS